MSSAVRESERWKTRFGVCTAIAVVALLALGAKDVTEELRQRPRQRQWVDTCVRDWTQSLLLEVPADQAQPWQHVAERYPVLVLRACATEAQEQRHVNE